MYPKKYSKRILKIFELTLLGVAISYSRINNIQLKKFKIFDYSTVDNHPKMDEILLQWLQSCFYFKKYGSQVNKIK